MQDSHLLVAVLDTVVLRLCRLDRFSNRLDLLCQDGHLPGLVGIASKPIRTCAPNADGGGGVFTGRSRLHYICKPPFSVSSQRISRDINTFSPMPNRTPDSSRAATVCLFFS